MGPFGQQFTVGQRVWWESCTCPADSGPAIILSDWSAEDIGPLYAIRRDGWKLALSSATEDQLTDLATYQAKAPSNG